MYPDNSDAPLPVYVYVLGPIGPGIVVEEIKLNMVIAAQLIAAGFIPHIPALLAFLHFNFHVTVDYQERYSKAWIDRCDCVLALDNARVGFKSLELIEYAKKLKKPIYHSVNELLAKKYEGGTLNGLSG
jgi:hypothetical protein